MPGRLRLTPSIQWFFGAGLAPVATEATDGNLRSNRIKRYLPNIAGQDRHGGESRLSNSDSMQITTLDQRASVAELAPLDPVPQSLPPVNMREQSERAQIVRALEQSNRIVGGRKWGGCPVRIEADAARLSNVEAGIGRADSADGSRS